MHRPHYKIKKRLANIQVNVAAARLLIVEAIADDEPRAYAMEFLKQIDDFAQSVYRVIDADRQREIERAKSQQELEITTNCSHCSCFYDQVTCCDCGEHFNESE